MNGYFLYIFGSYWPFCKMELKPFPLFTWVLQVSDIHVPLLDNNVKCHRKAQRKKVIVPSSEQNVNRTCEYPIKQQGINKSMSICCFPEHSVFCFYSGNFYFKLFYYMLMQLKLHMLRPMERLTYFSVENFPLFDLKFSSVWFKTCSFQSDNVCGYLQCILNYTTVVV